jgi:hypothetical protein
MEFIFIPPFTGLEPIHGELKAPVAQMDRAP